MRSARIEAGTSALEALVALTLAAIVISAGLALAVKLTKDVQSDIGAKPLAALEDRVALDRLEHELRQAIGVVEPSEGTADRLRLVLPSGDQVEWTIASGGLRRGVLRADGTQAQRIVLTGLERCAFEREGRLLRVILQRTDGAPRQRAVLLRNLRSPHGEAP